MTFYAFASAWEAAPQALPVGTTLFAVGDVHGCSRHLDAILAVLEPCAARAVREGGRCELVLLGDYVDRGPDSLGVLRRLPGLGDRLGGKAAVSCLRGNHDEFLINHLGDRPHPGGLELWLLNGGLETVTQLGIDPASLGWDDSDGLSALAEDLRNALGPELVAFLQALPLHKAIGPYLCVHAGIRPDLPLSEQQDVDLLWIREPFLSARTWEHPFTVVHGHTPSGPEVRPHRINVDSGCFLTGVLTAVELEGDRLRFHAVSEQPDPQAFRAMADAR